MLRSTIRGAALLPFVLASCTPALDSPTQPFGGSEIFVQPALIPSAADATALPINRIETVTSLVGGALLSTDSYDVSPTADEWEIEITLPGYDQVTVIVQVFLMNVDGNGTAQLQFSGQTDPITVTVGEPATPDIPIVRGPLANLNTTAVTVSSAPAILREGDTAILQATAETSGSEAPSIFWASLDPAVVSIDGATAAALNIGTARVVASAGAFADTVLIEVLTSDVTAPMIVDRSPGPGALGVSPSAAVVVTFDESIDPASASTATVFLRDVQGADVPSTVSTSGATVTLTPDAVLDSLSTYTVTVGAVADLVGNVFPDPVNWSFTTASSAVLLSSFDAGLGVLVSIAFEPAAEQLYVYDDFADSIFVFSPAGARVGGGFPVAGPASNDIDLDFIEVAAVVGSTLVPDDALLVQNGEVNPGVLFAVDVASGAVIDSLPMPIPGNSVGGAYHAGRGLFYSVDWTRDDVIAMEMDTGVIVDQFPVAPAGGPGFGIFYGDLEVDPASGNIMLVSSEQNTVRVLTADGVLVRDVEVGSIGITGMSGIAWDAVNRVAWISTTTGMVFAVTGIL